MKRKVIVILTAVVLVFGLTAQTGLAVNKSWSTLFDFGEWRDNNTTRTYTTRYQVNQGWAGAQARCSATGIAHTVFNNNRNGMAVAQITAATTSHSHNQWASATPWW